MNISEQLQRLIDELNQSRLAVADLKERIQELEQDKEELRQKASVISEVATSRFNDLAEAREKNMFLQRDILDLKESLKTLLEEQAELSAERKSLNQEALKLSNKADDLNEEVRRLTQASEKADKRIQELEQERETLLEENKTLRATNTSLEREVSSLSVQLLESERELETLQSREDGKEQFIESVLRLSDAYTLGKIYAETMADYENNPSGDSQCGPEEQDIETLEEEESPTQEDTTTRYPRQWDGTEEWLDAHVGKQVSYKYAHIRLDGYRKRDPHRPRYITPERTIAGEDSSISYRLVTDGAQSVFADGDLRITELYLHEDEEPALRHNSGELDSGKPEPHSPEEGIEAEETEEKPPAPKEEEHPSPHKKWDGSNTQSNVFLTFDVSEEDDPLAILNTVARAFPRCGLRVEWSNDSWDYGLIHTIKDNGVLEFAPGVSGVSHNTCTHAKFIYRTFKDHFASELKRHTIQGFTIEIPDFFIEDSISYQTSNELVDWAEQYSGRRMFVIGHNSRYTGDIILNSRQSSPTRVGFSKGFLGACEQAKAHQIYSTGNAQNAILNYWFCETGQALVFSDAFMNITDYDVLSSVYDSLAKAGLEAKSQAENSNPANRESATPSQEANTATESILEDKDAIALPSNTRLIGFSDTSAMSKSRRVGNYIGKSVTLLMRDSHDGDWTITGTVRCVKGSYIIFDKFTRTDSFRSINRVNASQIVAMEVPKE